MRSECRRLARHCGRGTGTRIEVLALRTLFPGGAEVFLGPEATEERAKALGREASIIHFTCHALIGDWR